MNKWSFLLLPVLWLVQSATSKGIFVDGRHGRFDYPSRSLLSNKRLNIYESRCFDETYNEISELRTSTRDIHFSNKCLTLKRSSRLDHRLEQSRLSSGNSKRVSANVPFRFGDSTRYNSDDRTVLRSIEESKLRNHLRSGPREYYGENRADRIIRDNNDRISIRIQRNPERNINLEQEKINMLRNQNFRERSDHQDDRVERNNARESRADEHRNINLDRRFNKQEYEVSNGMVNRDRHMVARLESRRYIIKHSPVQRENERDESRRNSGSKQKDESYSNQRLRRHMATDERFPEIREIRRQYVRLNLDNEGNSRYISIQNTERFSKPGRFRQIRDDSIHRQREESFVEHLTRNIRDNRRILENGQFERVVRRNQALRETVTQRRERDERYRLAYENRMVHDLRAIRLVNKRNFEDMLDEERTDTRHILLNNKEQNIKDRVSERVLERENDRIRLHREHFRSIPEDNRNEQREESDANRRLIKQETRVNRIAIDLRSKINNKNSNNVDEDISRHFEVEQRDDNRVRLVKTVRELREVNKRDSIVRKRERTVSNIIIHSRHEAVRATRIMSEQNQERLSAIPQRETDINQRRTNTERLSKENRLGRLRFAKRISESDMGIAITTRTKYDNHDSEDMERNNNRNRGSRNKGERLASRDKRSLNLRRNNDENENRMQNGQRQTGMNILQVRSRRDERVLSQLDTRRNFNRIATERRTRINEEISNAKRDHINRNTLFRMNERVSVEIRANKMPSIREFKTIEKRESGRCLLRNRNSIIETAGKRMTSEFGDTQNEITERIRVLLKYEDDRSNINANRKFEQKRGLISEYRIQMTRSEDHNNNRMRERREVRSINDNSDTRDFRQEVNMRPAITVNPSFRSNRDRTRQVTPNINAITEEKSMRNVRINERKSKNTLRDLQVAISDRRLEADREFKAHKDITTRVRQNERLERSGDTRLVSNSRSERRSRSVTQRTSEQERVLKPAFRTGYDVFEPKNQSDNQIFEMKWQYVFYLIQGMYILNLLTKQMNDSDGMLKPRFANCLLSFPTLKVD